jgi:hypothetical protein
LHSSSKLSYAAAMARGWESKAVESQQDDASRTRITRRALTAEERDQQTRRETLGLALAQAQSELTAACRPAHRDMIHLRITALRDQLDALGAPEDR